MKEIKYKSFTSPTKKAFYDNWKKVPLPIPTDNMKIKVSFKKKSLQRVVSTPHDPPEVMLEDEQRGEKNPHFCNSMKKASREFFAQFRSFRRRVHILFQEDEKRFFRPPTRKTKSFLEFFSS